MLSGSQSALVAEALRTSLRHAAAVSDDPTWARSVTDAADALPSPDTGAARPDPGPHPALPGLGTTITRELRVTDQDTAAAMGHPDPSVSMLGSPRISLWFELVASELLPAPTPELTHVGSGILVHHLAPAGVGEDVTVRATAEEATGRRVVFACTATAGSRCVAIGVHQRVLLDRR
jgi:predicted thioesterase